MEELHPYEELFYQGAMVKYYDDLYTIINSIIVSILGDDKAKREFERSLDKQ